MKITILSSVLIAVMMTLGYASVSAQATSLPGTRWKLTQLNEKPMDTATAFIEFSDDRKNTSGNGGCNRFFGGVNVGRGTMRFSGLGSTRMACPATMEVEAEFFAALGAVTRFRIIDGELTMLAGRNVILKFTGEKIEDAASPGGFGLEDRKWILESIKGKAFGSTQAEPFINFNGSENGAGGNTSCNVFGGEYSASDGVFKLSMPISTLRACIEDSSMEVEIGMLDGLQQADRFEIFEDRLTLLRGREVLLVFRGTDK